MVKSKAAAQEEQRRKNHGFQRMDSRGGLRTVIGVILLSCLLTLALVRPSWSSIHFTRPSYRQKYAAARARVMVNIGPQAGAADGVIIASPSNGSRPDEPDYYVGRYRLFEGYSDGSIHGHEIQLSLCQPLYRFWTIHTTLTKSRVWCDPTSLCKDLCSN